MSRRITLDAMKKALPPGTKGIAFYSNSNNWDAKPDKKRMTYAEFLKLPSKQKGKIRTITYWAGHNDGPDYDGGAYYEVWMTIKINRVHVFEFLAVEKVLNSGKRSYVSPTKNNTSSLDGMF